MRAAATLHRRLARSLAALLLAGLVLQPAGVPPAAAASGASLSRDARAALDNLLLAARVRSALICEWPGIRASAADGVVFIDVEAQLAQESKVRDSITAAASTVTGVAGVRVNVRPKIFP